VPLLYNFSPSFSGVRSTKFGEVILDKDLSSYEIVEHAVLHYWTD